MPRIQNSKLKKLRTVLSVLLLIITFTSVSLTAAETGHKIHCADDNCPICFVIRIVESNLSILILLFASYSCFKHFAKSEKLTLSSINKSSISYTLISLKTRLND